MCQVKTHRTTDIERAIAPRDRSIRIIACHMQIARPRSTARSSMHQRHQRAAGLPALSIDDPAPADVAAALADPRPSPALGIDLERALAALPDAQRWALIHCYHLELSHEEAADVLGWPLGTLKSHLARGKAALPRSAIYGGAAVARCQ